MALLLSLAPETQLRGMLFWLIGDLSSPPAPWLSLAVLVLGVMVAMPFARDLNALSRGETAAAALGVSRHLPWLIFALAALLTAVAVTTAGAIGFVGLIVPHAVRLVLGNDQRIVLPASVLAGGALAAGRRHAGAAACGTGTAAGRRDYRADRRAAFSCAAAARSMSDIEILAATWSHGDDCRNRSLPRAGFLGCAGTMLGDTRP